MIKKLVIKFLSRRASKFVAAGLGSAVTWVATFGIPLDQWLSDQWMAATGAAITSALVYGVRNIGD